MHNTWRQPCKFLIGISWLAASVSADTQPNADAGSLPDIRIERLEALGRLWGEAKYLHPYLAYRDVDWDRALVETIPKVEAAQDNDEYCAAVGEMLSFLEDSVSRVVAPSDDTGSDEPPQPFTPQARRLDDGIFVIDARDHRGMAATGLWRGGLFDAAFEAAAEATGVVLDMRRLSEPWPDDAQWPQQFVARSLETDLWRLAATEILLPAKRSRIHSGYASQRSAGSGGYYSGFVTRDHPVIAAGRAESLPLVVLVNDGTDALWSVLGGLKTAGAATIIHQGERSTAMPSGAVNLVEMADGCTVALRTQELVGTDGSTSFEPHVVLPPTTGDEDPAYGLALEILRGTTPPPRSERAAPTNAAGRRYFDRLYSEMNPPSREYRLLAFFRFWNVIERFFPYKHLLDDDWDDMPRRFIPKLADADEALEYALAVHEMVAQIRDSHGFVSSPAFHAHVGRHQPALLVRFIENELVVTYVSDDVPDGLPEAGTSEIRVGDVVESVDGESIASRRQRLAPYVAVSTPQALRSRLSRMMLTGVEGSEARILVRGADGGPRTVTLTRTARHNQINQLRLAALDDAYRLLPEGVGYADLNRLTQAEVPALFEVFREAPAIVFDMRGYPQGTAWAITPWLSAERRTAARFRRPLHLGGEASTGRAGVSVGLLFEQEFPAGTAPWQYEGRIVVLIDERAMSQAEHTCLFFESAYDDVTFVGSPTAGANGDTTSFPLPGGIWVTFSGHDVRHADGRQLQRVGIEPDVWVEPTIEGIRAGRDEVLEAAVAFLQANSDV